MAALGASAFVLLKLLAYAAWCWVGVRLLAPATPAAPLRRAAALAGIRVALGFGLGWLTVLGLSVVAPESNRLGLSLPVLLVGFVGLRWLEWSFVGGLAGGHWRRPKAVLLGVGLRDHLWRLGGLALSFATDLAGLFGVGALGLIPC